MSSEFLLRRQIVEIARRLYARGLVTATGGNLSARLRGGRMLVTPAGSCLGELRVEELLVVPLTGAPGIPAPAAPASGAPRPEASTSATPGPASASERPASSPGGPASPPGMLHAAAPAHRPTSAGPPPRRRPTSELPLHRQAYAERPEIGAVVHAHPPLLIAMTVAGLSLAEPVLPEVLLTTGPVPTAPYATPSTSAGADAIHGLIGAHDAILLDHHGAVVVGSDPRDAYRKLETLEHAAQVLLAARQLGGIQPLPAEEAARLQAMRSQAMKPTGSNPWTAGSRAGS